MRGISGFMGLVALFVLASVALAASPLDGTQWQIKLTNTAAKTPSEDRIRFEKGRFTSPLFQPKGFPTSNYTLTEEKNGEVNRPFSKRIRSSKGALCSEAETQDSYPVSLRPRTPFTMAPPVASRHHILYALMRANHPHAR